MELQTWATVLTASFQNIGYGIIQYIPNLVVALIIILLGWIVGIGIGRAIAQIVKALKIDVVLRNAGVDDLFSRAGYSFDAGRLLGGLVKWFIIAVFLVAALDILGLTQVNTFLRDVVLSYLPQVIIAVVILLAAAVIAEAVEAMVQGTAKASALGSPYLLGSVAKWAIWIFALLAALNQRNVAQVFVQTLFTGVVIAASLAIGLAFGLGGQHAAQQSIEKVRKHLEDRK